MAKQKIKLERGTVYQKTEDGNFFFRFQLNGRRKAKSLKTKNKELAIQRAEEMASIVKANGLNTIAAYVKDAKFGIRKKSLRLADAWDTYAGHPDRAKPATVAEQESYRTTWRDFAAFLNDEDMPLDEVTKELAAKYADHMQTLEMAVDTHNRKIRRLRKVFATLAEYCDGNNPFAGKALIRSRKEEQHRTRRLSFSKEQEDQLLAVLEDDKHKIKNKHELRILYILGLYTGQRLKDCALLEWDSVNFDRERIWVEQYKTGSEVSIPIAEKLIEALHEAEAWKCNRYVLPATAERYKIVDKKGKNVGANVLNIDVIRVIKWIGLEPSVKVPGRKKKVTVYGFHSLRHSFASHAAELGVPRAVVVSILGADSNIIDRYYTHIGDQAQEQAMQLISGRGSLKQRHQKALEYLDDLKKKTKQAAELERILRGE